MDPVDVYVYEREALAARDPFAGDGVAVGADGVGAALGAMSFFRSFAPGGDKPQAATVDGVPLIRPRQYTRNVNFLGGARPSARDADSSPAVDGAGRDVVSLCLDEALHLH